MDGPTAVLSVDAASSSSSGGTFVGIDAIPITNYNRKRDMIVENKNIAIAASHR